MSVFIPKDFRGRCKGYAFIEFENSQDCAAAIEGADRTQYSAPFSLTLTVRMFGRTLRLEPATGARKAPGSGPMREQRPRRFDSPGSAGSSASSGGFREYSTLRAPLPGFFAVRRPVALNQVNALVGRRMFGLAASVVLKRRVV